MPPPAAGAPSHRRRRWLLWAAAAAALAVAGYLLVPTVKTALDTVSTDDAYVNVHMTLVAPRLPGQVARVLVNDKNRVKKGVLLVQLDRDPYQVLVDIKRPAVVSAEADLARPLLEFRLEPIVVTIGNDRLEREYLHGKHS